MKRGSTNIISILVNGQTFDGCTVLVTLDQNGMQITKSNASSDVLITKNYDDEGNVTGSTLNVYYSQKETLNFDVGSADVQIRWIDVLDNAHVSNISTLSFERVLLEREIEYGE